VSCWQPRARRQARIRQRTGNRYLDNLYEEYGVCVELDGTIAHPEDEQWRDKRRDNANLFGGIVTFRFGFPELGDHRCESAAYVAAVLRSRGWPATPKPLPPPSLHASGLDFMIVASSGSYPGSFLATIMNPTH
jgi:hypothetical protein